MDVSNIKAYIFIATTAVGLTLYVHQTFATNQRVEKIEVEQTRQSKVSCLIALKLGVEKKEVETICDLKL